MPDLNQLLVLEVERAVLGGGKGAIVEGAYHRVLERHASEMTQEEKDELAIAKTLLEYELPFMAVQSQALKAAAASGVAEKWAKRNSKDWSEATESQKVNDMVSVMSKPGEGLAQARAYMDENYERMPKGMKYDVPDDVDSQDVTKEVTRIFINDLRDK